MRDKYEVMRGYFLQGIAPWITKFLQPSSWSMPEILENCFFFWPRVRKSPSTQRFTLLMAQIRDYVVPRDLFLTASCEYFIAIFPYNQNFGHFFLPQAMRSAT